jgi:hypothetical protein
MSAAINAARAAVCRRVCSSDMQSAFEGVPAELVTVIAEHLMRLTKSDCVALAEETRLSCRSFYAFSSCCRSAHQLLKDSELNTEAACRRAAVVQPREWSRLPFTSQFKAEEQTRQLVKTIACGVASLATHCASAHCLAVRKMVNRENLACRLEVAHVCARRVALCESTAFLQCSSDEKTVSRWILAADMRGGTVWSPKSELRKVARVEVDEDVIHMQASGGVLLFSTRSGVFSWVPGEPLRSLESPVPGMIIADFWVCRGEARLLLASDDVNAELFQIETDLSVRCVVAHMRWQPTRYTNEIQGFHSNLRPNADGSVALAVTLTNERARVQLLDPEEDREEVISEEHARGQIVAVCLSPKGDAACVFALGMNAVANVFMRLSADSWTLLAAVTVPGQPSAFGSQWPTPSKIVTGATFSACGSRVLFHGPRITARPAIGSLELNGVLSLSAPKVRVKNASIEALPREILFSTSGVLLRTHRGACVVRTNPHFGDTCVSLSGKQ